MSFTILFDDIPDNVARNYLKECGRGDIYLTTGEYLKRREDILREFKVSRSVVNGTYTFESEAHYTWFVLRYS